MVSLHTPGTRLSAVTLDFATRARIAGFGAPGLPLFADDLINLIFSLSLNVDDPITLIFGWFCITMRTDPEAGMARIFNLSRTRLRRQLYIVLDVTDVSRL